MLKPPLFYNQTSDRANELKQPGRTPLVRALTKLTGFDSQLRCFRGFGFGFMPPLDFMP